MISAITKDEYGLTLDKWLEGGSGLREWGVRSL